MNDILSEIINQQRFLGFGQQAARAQARKVFCVGLHKTGTRSLCDLATQMGYKALHSCQWSGTSPNLQLLNEYDFFSDGGGHFWHEAVARHEDIWGPCHNLSYLSGAFPEAKFILNTRPLDEWLRSKMFQAGWRAYTQVIESTLSVCPKRWTEKSLRVIEEFVRYRINYHTKAINFFKNRGLTENLLVIDYTNDVDAVPKIEEFLGVKVIDERLRADRPHHHLSLARARDRDFIDSVVAEVFIRLKIENPKQLL